MGFLDRFSKKKETHYDSSYITVRDLDVGFIFEYDLQPWEVKALYEYDWGDNCFSREFKIDSGLKVLFLALEEEDELILSVSAKVKVRKLGDNVHKALMLSQKPPDQITYQDRSYFFEKESPGYFRDVHENPDAWAEFNSWDYEDESGEYIITIEQWSEKEFEAVVGRYIKEFEISKILPAAN